MSLISEQIKELRRAGDVRIYTGEICIPEMSNLFNQAADTIESLSAKLQAENMDRSAEDCGGWILCEDRLPQKHIDVLVSFDDGDPVIAWYSEVNKHWKNSSTDNVITADVIAWQPLPEPYRPQPQRS